MAVLDVTGYSGQIIYPASNNFSGNSYKTNNGEDLPLSGCGGGGRVWSSIEQVIYISVGGVKYPVYLKPGWNDVNFWIPNLYSEDVWVEVIFEIESEGYILVPAGFNFSMLGVEPLHYNKKMSDKFKFDDLYDIEIYTPPEPVNLDGMIDKLDIVDFNAIEVVRATINNNENIEEVSFKDLHNMEIILPPFSGEADEVDNYTYDDNCSSNIMKIKISDNVKNDDASFEDIYNLDFE